RWQSVAGDIAWRGLPPGKCRTLWADHVLRREPARHLRLLLVVRLDLLNGLLRLWRRCLHVDAGRCGPHAFPLKQHVSTAPVEMDLAQVLRRDLVRMAGRGELQQPGLRGIGDAPMKLDVQRVICAVRM